VRPARVAVSAQRGAPLTLSSGLFADYPALEVWDTTEVDALAEHLKSERLRLHEVYRVAKEEQRKVLWKDAQFDLKRMDRLEKWILHVKKDGRRTW